MKTLGGRRRIWVDKERIPAAKMDISGNAAERSNLDILERNLPPMRIAYLITAFSNYEHLAKLIRALADEPRSDHERAFFVHIDKKSPLPDNLGQFKNLVFIDRTKVWWGGWSHCKAIIDLMRAASNHDFDHFVLLSGSDYPIRPNAFLYDTLARGGEHINLLKGFFSHKPEERIKYYHYDCFDRRHARSVKTRAFLALEALQRPFFKKNEYPFNEVYHGSTWWALSRPCVQYVLKYIDANPRFVKFFSTSWCPEESLIPTIIGNSAFLRNCRTNLTYTDWSTNPAPAIIGRKHIELFKSRVAFESIYGTCEPFFARKFADNCADMVELVERELRQS